MSRNYDNWERLVAAVVKREQIWQLCHQDSISTVSSSHYSCHLDLSSSVSFGSFFGMTDTFECLRRLRHRNFRTTDLVRLVQDVQGSDQQYLATGTKAVIKSLNTRNITQDEFEQHMVVLRNCRHENVATPSVSFFSETTKFIVYDYYSQGSVSDMLHGYAGNEGRPNWESRMRIAAGAARGIAHIHTQCGGKLAHGNIKSSNIFLNSQHYGCVSDFGLAGIPGMPATWWDALEYYSSEHEFKSPSQKSDVYSFGLLLLELVTGRSVVQVPYIANRPYTLNWSGFQGLLLDTRDDVKFSLEKLPFVDSCINTCSTLQQDLVKTLQLAMKCLAESPDHRPTMSQVVLELNSFERAKLTNSD